MHPNRCRDESIFRGFDSVRQRAMHVDQKKEKRRRKKIEQKKFTRIEQRMKLDDTQSLNDVDEQ